MSRQRPSIADEIARTLIQEILRGDIAAGEKLPPERELAVRFNTNRNTLREALRNLISMKLINARQGDGIRVLDFRQTGEWTLVPYFIQMEGGTIEERVQLLEDIMRLRRMLIEDVVRSLAIQGTLEEIREIRTLVVRQREAKDDPRAMVEIDLEILLAMVDASRSLTFKWVFNTVVQMYREIIFAHPGFWYFSDDYCDKYEALLDACELRDAQRAVVIIGEHFEESDSTILQGINALRDLTE